MHNQSKYLSGGICIPSEIKETRERADGACAARHTAHPPPDNSAVPGVPESSFMSHALLTNNLKINILQDLPFSLYGQSSYNYSNPFRSIWSSFPRMQSSCLNHQLSSFNQSPPFSALSIGHHQICTSLQKDVVVNRR